VGQFLQLIATFFGGFVIAFIKGWLLTIVMMSCIPLLVLSGAVMSMVITKASSSGQTAYSKAATVVEQTIGSIRTVSKLSETTPFLFVIADYINDFRFSNAGCVVHRRETSHS
jgi:ATP-binding cassette subfamily B (MDR/TAP) protein 1